MTRHSWPERLTPLTGGAAMALVVVAMVVQPAWAVTAACANCMSYWNAHAADAGQPTPPGSPPPYQLCDGLSGDQRQACISNRVSYECTKNKVKDSQGNILYSMPCNGPPESWWYSDCGSDTCSTSSGTYGSTCNTPLCTSCDQIANACQEKLQPGVIVSTSYVYCGCGPD